MASKQDIINNLREYSSDQLAEAIRSGVVTMYELSKSGNLTPLMRKRIEAKMAEAPTTAQNIQTADNPVERQSNTNRNTEENETTNAEPIDAPVSTVKHDNAETASDSKKNVLDNKGFFKRPFSFHGRIRRMEYGVSFIIYHTWYFFVMISIPEDGSDPSLGVSLFILLTFSPMLWFFVAQSCKRCHDFGNSGWWQLMPFYCLLLLFASGNEGYNKYGNNPKK